MLSRKEKLAYIAGLVDGEGCICISSISQPRKVKDLDKPYQPTHYLRLTVCMCERGGLDVIHSVFPKSITKWKHTKKEHKDIYRWAVNGKRVAEVLTELLPYLQVKHKQAKLAIEMAQLIADKGERNKRVTPAMWKKRQRFKLAMQKLNKRGK